MSNCEGDFYYFRRFVQQKLSIDEEKISENVKKKLHKIRNFDNEINIYKTGTMLSIVLLLGCLHNWLL